jgi:crossover junction endonuclease MUS81
MAYIRLDYRELKLYNALAPLVSEQVRSENLEIGDIEIGCSDPEIKLLFERKTQSDLLSSITDGRYREQKIRMLGQFPAHRCTYIIEGADITANTAEWPFPRISPAVYEGAIMHTMYRDKMHMVFTRDTAHTAHWLATLFKKLQAHPEKFIDGAETYISQVKTKSKKCENINTVTCLILQLSQVPGISSKIATEIVGIYPSLRSLISACDACETVEKKRALLEAIPMVGGKKADALLQYLQL